MTGWIGSSGHYQNLLDDQVNQTGIAVVGLNDGSSMNWVSTMINVFVGKL